MLSVHSYNNKAIILCWSYDLKDLQGWNRDSSPIVLQGKDDSREIEAMEHTPSAARPRRTATQFKK